MTSVTRAIVVNAAWAAAQPMWLPLWPDPIRMVLVTAIIVLLPGLCWDWVWPARSRVWGAGLARAIVTSTCGLCLVLAVLAISSIEPGAQIVWWVMVLLSNAGLIAGARRMQRPAVRLPAAGIILGTVLFAGATLAFGYAAVRIIPPLLDHDLEMQGPGYSMLARLTPRVLHDRELLYYFAHPPLQHLYVAASFLYQGHADALKVYDTVTAGAMGPRDTRALDAIVAHYERRPHLLETRAPGVVFAAAAVALSGLLAARRSRHCGLGLLAALTYATNPEVVVRSGYGGYFAPSALAMMLVLLRLDVAAPRGGFSGAAAWAALVNHKLALMPLGLLAGARLAGGGWMHAWNRLRGTLLAFIVASMGFWVWGLSIDADAFIADHVRHHLWDRLSHVNPLGYEGYLSMTGLWRQFAGHTGIVLAPIALILGVWDFRTARDGRERRLVAMLLGWTVITAVGFSIVDWRMTKHLSPLLLSLPLMLTPARTAPRWRVAAAVITSLWLLAWNMGAIQGLTADFESFIVTPAW